MDKIGEETLNRMKKAKFYNNWLYSLFKTHLGKDILEVGSGIGNFTEKLSEHGKVHTIDINKDYIKKFKNNKNISGGFGDIEKGKYFFSKKKFDTVICLNVLEHIKDHQSAFANMANLLEKNGKLILIVPAHQMAFSKIDSGLGHYRRYNLNAIKKLAKENNMKIIRLNYLNIPGLLGWFVNGRVLGRQLLPSEQIGLFDKIFIPWLILEKYIKPPFGLSVFLVAKK